jgi:hypothetical protein
MPIGLAARLTSGIEAKQVQFIGTIARLQIQQSSLKIGQAPQRRYDPAPIMHVDALALEGGGVRGWNGSGEPILDVHHPAHPGSRNRGGENGISVGFSTHYAAMRERFGAHLTDGIAGENILIETPHMLGEDDLRPGLQIETGDGTLIRLDNVIVAAPCVEFTRYAMRFPDDARPDATVTESLQFLNDGMRGYYATFEDSHARIEVGNRVFVR